MTKIDEYDRIEIRDLLLNMSIGIYASEKISPQAVCVSIILDVTPNKTKKQLKLSDVISYEAIVNDIEHLSKSKHYDLIEEFVEAIAQLCLSYNKSQSASVSAYKKNVLNQAASVGVSIKRNKQA